VSPPAGLFQVRRIVTACRSEAEGQEFGGRQASYRLGRARYAVKAAEPCVPEVVWVTVGPGTFANRTCERRLLAAAALLAGLGGTADRGADHRSRSGVGNAHRGGC